MYKDSKVLWSIIFIALALMIISATVFICSDGFNDFRMF